MADTIASATDLCSELRNLIKALDDLIACTGPNGYPRLAEAVAASESGIDEVVYRVWFAAGMVALLTPVVQYPYSVLDGITVRTRTMAATVVSTRFLAATGGLRTTMIKLFARWAFSHGGLSRQRSSIRG